jgi:hypothetical protein
VREKREKDNEMNDFKQVLREETETEI